MVDSIGSNLPPSVQAVNKARSNAQVQRENNTGAGAAADEVSISSEAQALGDVSRLASETRDLLAEQPQASLSSAEQKLDRLL